MESSRDDFIIAIRSAFLKKDNKQRFSLIGLIFFSIIFIVLSGLNFKVINYLKISIKEFVYRSSFIVSLPENYVKNTYVEIKGHFDLHEKYMENQKELKKIKAQAITNEFIAQENSRLKKVLDDYFVEESRMTAKVLVDKKSPFLRSVIINKGSKDNVKLGMAVLDEKYLIGKVVEVNYTTSRVLLLSDINSKIPVNIEPGGIQSILSGTGKDDGIIQYFKDQSDIKLDSVIYTSGSGELFKEGIPIGTIAIKKSENFVVFFSDFTQLRFVKVVAFKKEDN
jgi:rod shape-determining protein MreC